MLAKSTTAGPSILDSGTSSLMCVRLRARVWRLCLCTRPLFAGHGVRASGGALKARWHAVRGEEMWLVCVVAVAELAASSLSGSSLRRIL